MHISDIYSDTESFGDVNSFNELSLNFGCFLNDQILKNWILYSLIRNNLITFKLLDMKIDK